MLAIQEYNGKQFCYIINRNFVDYLPNELPLSDMISTWEAILLHLYEHCRLFAQHEWPLSNIIGNYENRKPESRAESVLTDNYESASRITPPPHPRSVNYVAKCPSFPGSALRKPLAERRAARGGEFHCGNRRRRAPADTSTTVCLTDSLSFFPQICRTHTKPKTELKTSL